MAKVFISYASSDVGLAGEMYEWLSSHTFNSFWDRHADDGIQPGSDWERILYRQVSLSHAMLLIVTPAWLKSKWCFFECAYARALGKPIFPVISTPTEKLVFASDIQKLDLTHDRERGLFRLEKALREIAEIESGGFRWDKTRPPFPGLLSFEEDDAAVFFGRENEVRSVCEQARLQASLGVSGLILLLGASGVGKSSLLRAGVLPRLRLDRRHWVVLPPFRPEGAALEELRKALIEGAGSTWQADLKADELAKGIRTRASAPNAKIIISIDQFEELYTLTSEAERKQFVNFIQTALSTQAFIVLATLRSDYLSEFQTSLIPNTHEIVVKPITASAMRDIITGPARLAGIGIDGRVIDAAILDAETGDALPLLAFTLREIFEAMDKRSNAISVMDYDRLGDQSSGLNPIQNAVRKVADQAVHSANPHPDELGALRNCFLLQLTTTTEDGRTLRRRAEWSKIPSEAYRLIERLAAARVLTIAESAGKKFIEITHEALLRHWGMAKTWLEEDREFLSWRRRVTEERLAWYSAPDNEKIGRLLSGIRLSQASYWLERKRDLLEKEDIVFIEVSIGIDKIETQGRLRERTLARVSTGIAALCVLAIIFLWYLQIH